jgi:hypothetical protein
MIISAFRRFGLCFEQINVSQCLIDKVAKRYQGVSRTQRRASCQVGTGGRKVGVVRRNHSCSTLAGADFSYTAAVFAKISGNVVLAIATDQHAFHNCNFSIGQCHAGSPSGWRRQVWLMISAAQARGWSLWSVRA